MEIKLILDENAWTRYKEKLDAAGNLSSYNYVSKKVRSYNHRHRNQPDKYPCLVSSKWWDDPNGPYTYDHDFLYYEDVVPLVNIVEEQIHESGR